MQPSFLYILGKFGGKTELYRLPTGNYACQEPGRYNFRGYSIVTSPYFYAKVKWAPGSFAEVVFKATMVFGFLCPFQ